VGRTLRIMSNFRFPIDASIRIGGVNFWYTILWVHLIALAMELFLATFQVY
jgi:hypothetical protein